MQTQPTLLSNTNTNFQRIEVTTTFTKSTNQQANPNATSNQTNPKIHSNKPHQLHNPNTPQQNQPEPSSKYQPNLTTNQKYINKRTN